jgi:hypothetical protein
MNDPKYVATVGCEYVEAADTLEALLALVRDLMSPDVVENVAIWADGKALVCVVTGDGAVTWLRPLTSAA